MSSVQEDTRPLVPLEERPQPRPPRPPQPKPQPPRPPARRDNSGCLYQGLGGLAIVVLALLIVALAGLAGWTIGRQEAQEIVAVTQAARVRDQIARIPGERGRGQPSVAGGAARLSR